MDITSRTPLQRMYHTAGKLQPFTTGVVEELGMQVVQQSVSAESSEEFSISTQYESSYSCPYWVGMEVLSKQLIRLVDPCAS